MKMNKLTFAAVALAGVGFLGTASQAMAQTFNVGDLILGFRDSTGTTGNNLEVDLGSAATFNYASSHQVTALNVNDLNTAFGGGNSFTTDTSLRFSISGSNVGATGAPLYFSNPHDSQPLPTIGGTTADDNLVANIYNASGDGATPNSNVSTELQASNSDSYSSAIGNVDSAFNPGQPYTKDFNFLTFSSEVTLAGSQPYSLDLIKYNTSGAHSDLGTFTLTTAGVLNFTAAPEPSTYVLMALGGVALFFVRRRMIQA